MNSIDFMLVANSIVLIILILNQNDNLKGQKRTSSNPFLENTTATLLSLQFAVLLIKIKNSYF